jgi:cytochrome c
MSMKKAIIWFIAVGLVALVPLVSQAACTKEDAVKAADYATGLLEKKGQAAFADLQNFRFCGQEGYIFIYDMNAVCLFHPISPKLVGKDQTMIQDAKGKYLVAEMNAKAKSPGGNGWVPYHWLNPKTGGIDAKCTYVKRCKMDGKDVWVAAGIYGSEDTCK